MKLSVKYLITVFVAAFAILSCGSDDKQETDPVVNPPVTTEDPTPENVRSFMVDPNATEETVALFYNLKKLSKTKFLVGQQDAFNGFYIKKATGSDPALLGSDFMFITDDQNSGQPDNWFYQQEQIITGDAVEAYNKGIVNIFSWHLREPFEGEHFYTSEMTEFQKANALRSILPGGENHDYYKAKLDKVANVFNNLRGADGKLIPAIFRPFHELDGSWFWWGSAYCTPQQYKQLWQFTVEYLRDVKQVHNLLYSYAPDNSYTTSVQYLERYPGDEYIDILGMDNYGDFNNQGNSGATVANNKLRMISDLAKEKVKIAALTETGYRVTAQTPPINQFFSGFMYNALTGNNVELAFVMFWNNNEDGYYVPPAGQADTQDFINFAEKEETVLQADLQNMYRIQP